MEPIWQALLEKFCEELNSDHNAWNSVEADGMHAVWQHKASGTIFEVKVG